MSQERQAYKQYEARMIQLLRWRFESEVRKIMLNIREESLKNILSVVPNEKIIAALGDEKIIAALGKEKLLAALSKEEMITALGGKENLLRTLLAELDPKQLHKLLEEKSQ